MSNTKGKKSTNTTEFQWVFPVLYWLVAAMLIIMKAWGVSTLTWFWTLIPITWPFILSFGIIGASLVIGLVFLILAAIVFGITEVVDTYEANKIKKERKEKKRNE